MTNDLTKGPRLLQKHRKVFGELLGNVENRQIRNSGKL